MMNHHQSKFLANDILLASLTVSFVDQSVFAADIARVNVAIYRFHITSSSLGSNATSMNSSCLMQAVSWQWF